MISTKEEYEAGKDLLKIMDANPEVYRDREREDLIDDLAEWEMGNPGIFNP